MVVTETRRRRRLCSRRLRTGWARGMAWVRETPFFEELRETLEEALRSLPEVFLVQRLWTLRAAMVETEQLAAR